MGIVKGDTRSLNYGSKRCHRPETACSKSLVYRHVANTSPSTRLKSFS